MFLDYDVMLVGRRVDREHFDAICFFSPGVRTEAADSPQRNLNVYRHNKFKPNVMIWCLTVYRAQYCIP